MITPAVVIHDYTGERGCTLGRLKRYGNDPHKNFLRIEHFDPAIKPDHMIRMGENLLDCRTYRVLVNIKTPAKRGIKTPQFWAQLATERLPIYLGGNVY